MSQVSSFLHELIQGGNDILSTKYVSISTTALVFYDHLLTLKDEVRYAWGGRKSWIFCLFTLNRYLPLVYTIWMLFAEFSPGYSSKLSHRCHRSAAIQPLFFIFSTSVAQVFLMLRIYALNERNKILLGSFASLTLIQLITGILLVAVPHNSVIAIPDIPLDAYRACLFNAKSEYETIYTVFSLCYDVVAFLSIVRSSSRDMTTISSLVRTLVRDATIYFIVIFTSHIILTFFVLFAREDIKLIPGVMNNILLPLMVSRLLMSLRKAGDPNVSTTWDINHFTSAMAATEPVSFGASRLRGARPEGTEATGQIEMVDMRSGGSIS